MFASLTFSQGKFCCYKQLLIANAKFESPSQAKHKHGWLDNNGKNDWDIWTVFIQEKNKSVWEATLNIANTANGEKILYDIGPIKMVEQASKSATSTTNPIIRNSERNVNTNFSDSNVSIVPKQWLLEFMLTDDFIYNYPNDSKLKPILNQAITKR